MKSLPLRVSGSSSSSPSLLNPKKGSRTRTICRLLLSACLLGCGRPHPAAPSHPPLRVAAYYWPGMYWIDIANDLGWFREAGLNVAIVDTNADYFASFKRTRGRPHRCEFPHALRCDVA